MKKVLQIFLKVLIVFIIITGIILGIAYWFVNKKLNTMNYEYIDTSKIEISDNVKDNTNINSYRNIAILGVDSRSDTYDTDRSDCIIIASLNENTKSIKLFSVYRDTYFEIPGYGMDKVNHAYWFGGPTLTLSTLNNNLDLNITEYITVNFEATKDIIDNFGGVEIDITNDELKYINGYIKEINSVTDGEDAKTITTIGKQILNGTQALAYSRIRYTDGGDWKRTERMRTVLSLIFDKTKSMNTAELYSFVDSFLPKISTNIPVKEFMNKIPSVASYTISRK